MSFPQHNLLTVSLLTLIFFATVAPSAQASEAKVDYDTTRVREVSPVKKSVGETIADIPGEILKLPFYTFELVSHALVMSPPFTAALSLVQTRGERATFVPVVGVTSRAGIKLGVGVKLLDREISGTKLRLKTYYSTHDYQFYRFRLATPHLFSSRIGLKVSVRYQKETRKSFFGFGMTSRRSAEANVTLENTVFQSHVPIRIGNSAKVIFTAKAQITNVFDGRHPEREGRLKIIKNDPALAVKSGQLDPLRHIDVGLTFELDRRNSAGRPTNGGRLLASYEHILGVERSEGRDFDLIKIDLQHFLHISRHRVLAIRTTFNRTDATGSNKKGTPYYLASQLGGAETLRGFTSGRFAGNDAAHISLEYRYPVYDHVDVFLFGDGGRVYQDVTKEAVFDNWRSSVGFGIRIWNHEEALAIVQLARSDETIRFFFDLGASW